MKNIKAIFSDVGGVLATNGWDHVSRRKAAEQFSLDFDEFEKYHDKVADDFDTGAITLQQYLNATVFYKPRSFSPDSFFAFMKNESQPDRESLAIMKTLSDSDKYHMATLNNESTELNRYRIEKFDLARYFSVFFTSCYLGLKKPGIEIYRKALLISNCSAEDAVFIDDREGNLVAAKDLNMNTILFKNADQLRDELNELGIIF